MRNLIFLLCFLPCMMFGQTGTWPVAYGNGAPSYTPSGAGTHIYIDRLTNDIYTYSTTWILKGRGIDQITGTIAPLYTPGPGQSQFAINNATPAELYRHIGGGVWQCINCIPDPGGDLSGTIDDITVEAIQNIRVSTDDPVLNEVMKFDGTEWAPGKDSAGVSDGNKGDLTISLNGTVYTVNPAAITGPKISQDGAFLNDAWLWNGDAWIPSTINNTSISAFRYWMSPVGSDANSGLSPLLPKKNISSLTGLLNSPKSVGFKSGSLWREQISAASNNLSVGSYARSIVYPYAILDGAQTNNAGWTSVSNYFTKSIPHNITSLDGYNNVMVMEIDTAMERYAPFSAVNYLTYKVNTSLVNSNPGSFTYTNSNPTIVAIRPTSGAPGSNKYRYEVVIRNAGVLAYSYDNINVSNLWVRNAGQGYGPISAGDNTTLNNVIISGAGTHHFVIKSGHINNVLFGRVNKDLPSGSTAATFYEVAGTGNVSSIRNSIFYKIPNGFIAHTSGGGNHQKIVMDNLYAFGDSSLYSGYNFLGADQVDTFLINRLYVNQYAGVGSPYGAYIAIRNSVFNNITEFVFRFEHPSSPTQLIDLDNIFWKSYATNANQSVLNHFAGLLYKPNANATVRLKNSTLHVKSTWTIGGDSNGGWNWVSSVTNSIVIAEIEAGRAVKNGSPTISENNVYILLKGDGFHWAVNPALNGGNPNCFSLALWKSITGLDQNSIFIDLRNNPLGLRAVFSDPDAGNYTLLPGGQYTAQINALKAGMSTPIRSFIETPTEEQCAESVMSSSVPLLLDWKLPFSGSNYNVPTNYVKWAPQVLHANRIPYVTAFNTIQDTTLLTYTPGIGVFMKGGNNSTGAALAVQNSDAVPLLTVNNNRDVLIGAQSSTANTTTTVQLIATDGSDARNSPGIALHSNQNGSVSPPNLTWQTYINGNKKNIYQIRGTFSSGFVQRSPENGSIWFQGASLDQSTAVTNNVTTLPELYPYVDLPQLAYFGKGTIVVGRDIASSNDAQDGEIRSGQKNNSVVPYNSAASNLTIKAGRGLGPVASNKGEIYFTTPDGAATGTVQPYTVKGAIKQDGSVSFGTISPSPSAKMQLNSVTQGFLPPRMTLSQRDAISSPATGLMIYCTDCVAIDSSVGVSQTYNGSVWKSHW